MEQDVFYNKFELLPIEAKKQVLLFIDLLQKKYSVKNKRNTKSISEKKFVGIWRNRKDLEDSSSWVRDLRKKEWKEIGK